MKFKYLIVCMNTQMVNTRRSLFGTKTRQKQVADLKIYADTKVVQKKVSCLRLLNVNCIISSLRKVEGEDTVIEHFIVSSCLCHRFLTYFGHLCVGFCVDLTREPCTQSGGFSFTHVCPSLVRPFENFAYRIGLKLYAVERQR